MWGPRGDFVRIRALLDTGAQGCLITTRVARRLHLEYAPPSGPIRGVGDTKVRGLSGQTHISVSPVKSTSMRIAAAATVLDPLVGWHPTTGIPLDRMPDTSGLTLADPHYGVPSPVDLILGADVLGWILLGPQRLLGQSSMVAVPTIFGHVLLGPVFDDRGPDTPPVVASTSIARTMLKFWEVEEPPMVSRLDPEHVECETFFRNHTRRLASGRFETRLPFIDCPPLLGKSRALAEKRLVAMERRMSRDHVFREKYMEFMREYESLGHMSRATVDWTTTDHYFLPHHAVLKASTGKLRTVFDGLATSSSGVSLNQCLHSGPKLHRDIVDIILNFRRHQVVFGADIRMMFRQTIIHPEDRRFQLILWREHPDDPVIDYELNTNTYGLKSSPFIAIRSLLELAERERARFPRAAAVLTRDTYVDDVCSGAQTIEEALIIRDELIGLLAAGGYELRKWLSNEPQLLVGIPEDHQQNPQLFEDAEDPNSIAVLGMQYQPVRDIFTFQTDLEQPRV